jgi:nitroimidazol reductase NimA-like FMN-containing flavoprotein (pyridoxamine 5'-phosphate oxidase superfamily)
MTTQTKRHRLEVIPQIGCVRHLREEHVGRIAVTVDGHPEIYPVNYAVDAKGRIVFRTDPGSKLGGIVRNRTIAFEIDGIDEDRRGGWSVLMVGDARWLSDKEAAALTDVVLEPWATGDKACFVRITPSKTTGRWINIYQEAS